MMEFTLCQQYTLRVDHIFTYADEPHNDRGSKGSMFTRVGFNMLMDDLVLLSVEDGNERVTEIRSDVFVKLFSAQQMSLFPEVDDGKVQRPDLSETEADE